MIFQEHGDVLIMAGRFQLEFEHCVPARERWENTFGHCQQFRPLSERELQGVQNEIARHGRQDGDGPDKRLNCTLRWNHNHNSHCPCHLGVQHGVQNKGTPSQVHPWPMQKSWAGRARAAHATVLWSQESIRVHTRCGWSQWCCGLEKLCRRTAGQLHVAKFMREWTGAFEVMVDWRLACPQVLLLRPWRLLPKQYLRKGRWSLRSHNRF